MPNCESSTFDGDPVTYVGQGASTPGLQVGGVLVPTGSALDVVVFNAGRTSCFYFPNDDLGLLGALAAVVDIDNTDAGIFPNRPSWPEAAYLGFFWNST